LTVIVNTGRGGCLDELTEKQAEIYSTIKKYQENHGFPPTQENLADNLNLGRSTIRDHLSALEKKGFISRIWVISLKTALIPNNESVSPKRILFILIPP
jgi:SOS-response transcriptional repressor LexA